jgi:hypothetical protein
VKIFPDVDNRFKFGFLKVIKGVPTPKDHAFDARFYLHNPAQANGPAIRYTIEMMRHFSPQNFSLMEFRTERDLEICTRIRGAHELLLSFGHQFRRELHATGDSRFLKKIGPRSLSAGEMPLIEGKTIFQYDPQFTVPTFLVVENRVRDELMRKEIHRLAAFVRGSGAKRVEGINVEDESVDLAAELERVFSAKDFRLHYEFRRLAYREVGSSTNERTLIATVVPAKCCMSHKLMYLTPYRYGLTAKGSLSQEACPETEILVLLGLFNSLVLNYYVRSKVSTGVSVFQLNELPIPKLGDKLRAKLAAAAEKLLASPHDTKERARLEVLVAREVYGLDAADWQHLTGTFTYGSGDTKAELDEIIARSREL